MKNILAIAFFLTGAFAFAQNQPKEDVSGGSMTAPAGGDPKKAISGPTNTGKGLNGANMGSGSSTATGNDTYGTGEPGVPKIRKSHKEKTHAKPTHHQNESTDSQGTGQH